MIFSETTKSQIEFGIFADCQYCDCETWKTRYFRNSLNKLNDCITQFNQNENIEFVVNLGDLIDRDFSSFDSINPILSRSKTKVFQVVGNHDLEVKNEYFEKVPEKLNLTKTWYSFEKEGWLFLFLNGNDITYNTNNEKVLKLAEFITSKLKKENKPNFYDWNGGIGKKQLIWLEKQLQNAQKNNLKVIIFCHYPLLPLEQHTLWNSDKVLIILQKFDCVKLWLNGHNHEGNYTFWHGIHFLNLKAMVETENTNSFAIVKLDNKTIEISGFGDEPQLVLNIGK